MRLGTRGSALALAQARWVAERIEGDVEIVPITTTGDRAATAGGDKSRWVSELERALLEGEIDAAVHSAKDVPGTLASDTGIVAVPAREDPRDAICGARSLHELAPGARVGTSSLRRTAQLRALRPDLEIVAIRGNVDTRLRKLADGECDVLVLALAGLRRLGREQDVGGVLDELVPAPGQGALAVQAKRESEVAYMLVKSLDDPNSNVRLGAERDLMLQLRASCDTPVGAQATVIEAGEAMEMRAWIGMPDGSEWLADQIVDKPWAVSGRLAQRLLSAGAEDLLARAARSVAA
jgi:hydroxymethylbilane synthase